MKLTPLVVNTIAVRFSHSEKTDVVYVGPLSKQIRSVKLFSLITSLSGLFAQPVIYERAQELETSVPVIVAVCSFVGFFTFVTPLLLHFVTKKYVTLITHDSKTDTYCATIYTLFLRKREITFRPGEPIVPDVLGMFTSMSVRGIPLFVDAKFFDDVDHYKRIMGYDKPIDLKLGTPAKPTMTDSH